MSRFTRSDDRRAGERRTQDSAPPVVERRHCVDRRHDVDSRERVEWLEVRYRHVTELLIGMLVTTLLVVTVGFVVLGTQADDLAEEVKQRVADTRERVDQGCRISEGKQLEDVQQLRATYKYLLDLTPAERRDRLNQAILASLPKAERDARQDDAPDYCDQPHVGLPEPDPRVPDRPAALRG